MTFRLYYENPQTGEEIDLDGKVLALTGERVDLDGNAIDPIEAETEECSDPICECTRTDVAEAIIANDCPAFEVQQRNEARNAAQSFLDSFLALSAGKRFQSPMAQDFDEQQRKLIKG